jgi:PKD repeat protein
MKYLLFLIGLFKLSYLFSQNELKLCGADEMRIEFLKANPKIAKAVIKRDIDLENHTKAFEQNNILINKNNSTTPTYIVPVVFHVIHNYGIENISDSQILDGLEWVNKTFRKTRPDTASMVQAFKGIHADCDIEFRLAKKDPNGNCHNGINRIASPLTSSGDHRVKELIHWPTNKYLNVYIVANAAGLAGHAVWPSDADTIPEWDGIVLSHSYVGTIGTSNLQRSVAFAHECGHYLNLQHIWGGNNVPGFYFLPCADPNKDCSIDDGVSDTPTTIGWQSCNLTGASCTSTLDNVQNVMDYSYCNVMFTQGQKSRMQACITSTIAGRNNLWQPANLTATGVDISATLCGVNFSSNKKYTCPNSSVIFENTSFQGPFDAITWQFQGGNPSTSSVANPTVTYASAGNYNVTLKVKIGTDSITVTKPNYISIQNTSSTGITYPFSESFETNSLTAPDWFVNNLDTGNTWQITNTAAYTGTKSLMLNNFSSTLNGKDEIYSRAINLTGASALNIAFKYAFARKDTSNRDQLQLVCIQNCNGTSIPRFTATGAALETVTPINTSFVPTIGVQWKTGSATIPSLFINNTFHFKFVFTGNGGNNLYIDDINISVDAGINNLSEHLLGLELFPNPASNEAELKFELNATRSLSVNVYSLLGQKIYEIPKQLFLEGNNTIPLNTSSFESGMYLVQISDGSSTINKSLIITK